ncbi:MAG: DUF1015 family protein [Gemmatimonadota bacterium]|nr:DUF1015 family protein [Gemmatimonadota bacterium]
MISIHPIPRALVPVDSDAASRVSAPNYDEFQGDFEIWELLQSTPESVLAVTMAHCDAPTPEEIAAGDSEESLERAAENMSRLIDSPLTRVVARVLYVYEIVDPARPGVRQIGLGGLGRTDEIRTDATPDGPIIRNEGVREPKARGRANLIRRTAAFIGGVNNAVPDASGRFAATLERYADGRPVDYEVIDAAGNTHRIWLVQEPGEVSRLQQLLSDEPEAYVADGNHRSAAAAMLGYEFFLTVFFPADRMGIKAYNRLVCAPLDPAALDGSFEVLGAAPESPFQPTETHLLGLYTGDAGWLAFRPREGSFDPADATASIDHAIVQRNLFDGVLGISDPGDDRLVFVGANKDAAWLHREVDAGRADFAVTIPPVTMEQFIAVCRQGRLMPPKSTWFEPKIRSGLAIALI